MGEIETKKGKMGKVHDVQTAYQKLIEAELKTTEQIFYTMVKSMTNASKHEKLSIDIYLVDLQILLSKTLQQLMTLKAANLSLFNIINLGRNTQPIEL